MDIDEILDMSDWNNPPEVKERARNLARDIRAINAFLQPMHKGHGKNVWDNCALILSDRTDEELAPYLRELFEWVRDMNWSGSEVIFQRLRKCERNQQFDFALDCSVDRAMKDNDDIWLGSIREIVSADNTTLYNLVITDTEQSYEGYTEDFNIGYFETEQIAHEVAEYYLKNIPGFKDCDCRYKVIPKLLVRENSNDLWVVSGWNTNERNDEVDIIESELYGYEVDAGYCRDFMQDFYSRAEWDISHYSIGKKYWEDGFVRG